MNKKEIMKNLYLDGFPEDAAHYVDYFFDNMYDDDNAMLNKTQTSGLHIVYKRMQWCDDVIKLPYLVAVSTLTANRGSGEISALIKKALQRLDKEKIPFVALYPFNHDYYKKYGFDTVDYKLELDVTNAKNWRDKSFGGEEVKNNLREIKKLYARCYEQFDVYLVRTCDDIEQKLAGIQDGEVTVREVYNGDGDSFDKAVAFAIIDREDYIEAMSGGGELLKFTTKPNVQARVVNIKVALEGYEYHCSDRIIRLAVKDNFMGDSNWRLSIWGGCGYAYSVNEFDEREGDIQIIEIPVVDLTKLLISGDGRDEYQLQEVFSAKKVHLVDRY